MPGRAERPRSLPCDGQPGIAVAPPPVPLAVPPSGARASHTIERRVGGTGRARERTRGPERTCGGFRRPEVREDPLRCLASVCVRVIFALPWLPRAALESRRVCRSPSDGACAGWTPARREKLTLSFKDPRFKKEGEVLQNL